jgi:hypothetical protein
LPRKKPKHNPKLEKQGDKRRSGSYQKDVDSYEEKRYYSRFYMILIFVGIVAVLTTLLFVIFEQGGERIERHDLVRLDYEIYSYADYQDRKAPTIKEMNVWVNVSSRYDETGNGTLIKGFYKKLLGSRAGDFLNFHYIENCKDDNKDGYNDVYPEKEALSYGYPSNHSLYNTEIILWFKIHEIKKNSTVEIQAGLSTESKDIVENNIQIFNYILVVNRKKRIII